MDATPSFGVSMISEVPSNPQLTLVTNGSEWHQKFDKTLFEVHFRYGKPWWGEIGQNIQKWFYFSKKWS